MSRDVETGQSLAAAWRNAHANLLDAATQLADATPGLLRQRTYVRLLEAQRACTALAHGWLADALAIERVAEPHSVLSLDVDGVLEEEMDGFSATGVTGAAALRLLQAGGVAVVLNTARSLEGVKDRVAQFALLGGVGSFGAAVWDNVYQREYRNASQRGAEQLNRLRQALEVDPVYLIDPGYTDSVRVSRCVDGRIGTIPAPAARALLDRHGFTDLTFWVAPVHTDFVDRHADKASGLVRLLETVGLTHMPLAAIGDGECDITTLRQAASVFLPAATLPSYTGRSHQRLVRSRYLGQEALWDAANRLVTDPHVRRRVRSATEAIEFPEWFPVSLRRRPPSRERLNLPKVSRFLIRRPKLSDFKRRP